MYARAFPGLDIVAHADTRRIMDANCRRYVRGVLAPDSPNRTALAELEAKLTGSASLPAPDRIKLETNITERRREFAELEHFWSPASRR